MATLAELRGERLRKLEELKKAGINPYPAKSLRDQNCQSIVSEFSKFENKTVTLAGRITAIRNIGKIAFIIIKDASGQVQLFWKKNDSKADNNNSELSFDSINLLDSGDFVEASGDVIKTQTGEISIDVKKLRILSKSLRPMPTDWDGFTNKEERLRRRYVDTNVNKEVFDRYLRRSKFWQSARDFLNQEDFVEINIPVLEHTTGGADAKPFSTHMDALGQDFYLRISHELPLKRLLVGGYEKVFDIGPRFRNENYSDEHLPEHVAMEWYWAYADWNDGMKLTQRFIRYIADQTWGKRKFKLQDGHEVDLGPDDQDWQRISFIDIIKKHYDLDVFDCSVEEAASKLKNKGGEVEQIDNKARVIDKLWKKIRVDLAGPVFLVDIPAFLQPLAKLQEKETALKSEYEAKI